MGSFMALHLASRLHTFGKILYHGGAQYYRVIFLMAGHAEDLETFVGDIYIGFGLGTQKEIQVHLQTTKAPGRRASIRTNKPFTKNSANSLVLDIPFSP